MTLRPIEPSDLEWIRAMRNSPEVYAHVRERRLLTEADQKGWYERLTDLLTARYYAWEASGYRGVVGLTALDWVNRSAEIAVMCDSASQEPDAATEITNHAFAVLGLHRLYADCITPARAVMLQAAGFSQEGEAREAYWRDGHWVTATRWFRLATPPTSGSQTP